MYTQHSVFMIVQVLPCSTLKTSNAILFCKTVSRICIPLVFNRERLFSVSFRALTMYVLELPCAKHPPVSKREQRWMLGGHINVTQNMSTIVLILEG